MGAGRGAAATERVWRFEAPDSKEVLVGFPPLLEASVPDGYSTLHHELGSHLEQHIYHTEYHRRLLQADFLNIHIGFFAWRGRSESYTGGGGRRAAP